VACHTRRREGDRKVRRLARLQHASGRRHAERRLLLWLLMAGRAGG
jgi:hypothetical protein